MQTLDGPANKEFRGRRKDPAYRIGWEDGRFGPTGTFLENPNLAEWAGHRERLAYYRGHRDGRRVRERLAHAEPGVRRAPLPLSAPLAEVRGRGDLGTSPKIAHMGNRIVPGAGYGLPRSRQEGRL